MWLAYDQTQPNCDYHYIITEEKPVEIIEHVRFLDIGLSLAARAVG